MSGSVHTKAYQTLLQALKDARAKAGLSQAQLAERLGKPASFVGKYELGERRLDLIEVLVIADKLDQPVAELVANASRDLPSHLG